MFAHNNMANQQSSAGKIKHYRMSYCVLTEFEIIGHRASNKSARSAAIFRALLRAHTGKFLHYLLENALRHLKTLTSQVSSQTE